MLCCFFHWRKSAQGDFHLPCGISWCRAVILHLTFSSWASSSSFYFEGVCHPRTNGDTHNLCEIFFLTCCCVPPFVIFSVPIEKKKKKKLLQYSNLDTLGYLGLDQREELDHQMVVWRNCYFSTETNQREMRKKNLKNKKNEYCCRVGGFLVSASKRRDCARAQLENCSTLLRWLDTHNTQYNQKRVNLNLKEIWTWIKGWPFNLS